MPSPQADDQEPGNGTGLSAPRDIAPQLGGRVPAYGRPVLRPIPRWVLRVGIPVMMLVAGGAVWLLLGLGAGRDQLDAVRTGSTIGVGLGGAVVLWLAVRRQRSNELDLLQKYEAHGLSERVAQDARSDALARRITELYGKAADQLGSDKSAVRIAGLYGLERLAQDNDDPRLRQMIVNVLSAYLRMPVGEQSADGVPEDVEENTVRGIVLDVLLKHLTYRHPAGPGGDPGADWWGELDLNLSGAVLPELNFVGFKLRSARFDGVEVIGKISFVDGSFGGRVTFEGAHFRNSALVSNIQFNGPASFQDANFGGEAWITDCTFGKAAQFYAAKFQQDVAIERSCFNNSAMLHFVRCYRGVTISGNEFEREVFFGGARFYGYAKFGHNKFFSLGCFDRVYLIVDMPHIGPDPYPAWVRFAPEEPLISRIFPAGFTVEPTDKRPKGVTAATWGRLVRTSTSLTP